MERDNRPIRVRAQTNNIVKRMFLDTADQGCAVARWAFFQNLYTEFWWSGLHALEKYLKAILLLNGCSAKNQGHKIQDLLEDVRNLDESILFDRLIKPSQIDDEFFFREMSIDEFFERLSSEGNSNNRYMLYGYSVMEDDIYKFDQVVWQIRRLCRPFHSEITTSSGVKSSNLVEILMKDRANWFLGDHLIERALKEKLPSGATDALLDRNFSFAPSYPHENLGTWRSASANPPFAGIVTLLRSARENNDASAEEYEAVIRWALDHIHFSREDRNALEVIMLDRE